MSAFLTVLITVLKIIGIVLLSVLGFLLFVLLLILFVPVRYKAEGSYKENKPEFMAKLTFLLHLLSITFDISKEDKLTVKVFGIRINKKKSVEEEEDNTPEENNLPDGDDEPKEKNDDKVEDNSKELVVKDADEIVIFDKNEEKKSSDDRSAYSDEDEKKENKRKEKDKSNSHKFNLYDRISAYDEIIQSKEFIQSFELCKKQLGNIIKAVLPKKWKVFGTVGFDDPSATGKVAGILGMLYPLIHRNVFVKCDFENQMIDVSGYCKGRLFGITLLVVFLKVFFSRKIRKVIKMFKSVKK